MSMLAERRRKQKFIINPKGTIQNVDTNNVAWKMMQKMGWSKGKGLGANEAGMKEYIRVRYKNDTSGVGFKDTQEDNKSSDFNALLASLQASNGTTTTTQPDALPPKPASLEEKSQKSRARVHYKKFTRGKDLSRYSEKDLANIFGKKSLREPSDCSDTTDTMGGGEVVRDDQPENVLLKNCGSITDYFKTKSKPNGMKVTKLQVESDQEISFESDDTKTSYGGNEDNDHSQFEVVRKNKKKKSKQLNTYTNEALDTSDVNTCEEKKQKKKRKKVKADCFENPAFDFTDSNNGTIPNSDFEIKRKTKTTHKDTFGDSIESVDGTNTSNFEVKRKPKKAHHESEVYENPALNVEATEDLPGTPTNDYEVKRKTPKKSKKRKNDCFENPGLDLSPNDTTDSYGTPLKRKKSVRFSNVNQEHIIPSLAQQQQWEKDELFEINVQVFEKNIGLENGGFDLHKANLEENVNSIALTIDKYQAEIENDINEAKVIE